MLHVVTIVRCGHYCHMWSHLSHVVTIVTYSHMHSQARNNRSHSVMTRLSVKKRVAVGTQDMYVLAAAYQDLLPEKDLTKTAQLLIILAILPQLY